MIDAPSVSMPPRFRGDSDPVATHQFLHAADRIGATLCRDPIWSGDRCNWLGWGMEPIGGVFRTCVRASGAELYEGTAGIGVFLAQLHEFTQDPHHRTTATGAALHLLDHVGRAGDQLPSGLYSGRLGMAWSLVRMGELLERPDWIEQGLDLAERGGQTQTTIETLDIIAGSAGVIPTLIDLGQRYTRPNLLELAKLRADEICELATTDAHGTSWPSVQADSPALLGYSHGTSGMAVALAEVHRIAPCSRYQATLDGALRYERSFFDASQLNWPDRRPPIGAPVEASFPVAWCHGATGVGISRLRLLELQGERADLLEELDAAVQTASRYLTEAANTGNTADFSYCHGLAGTAEFLLDAAGQRERPDIALAMANLGDFGIQRYGGSTAPWPCGTPGVGESAGLLLGTSGIGYFLLRLHAPTDVPSVLLIRPKAPRATDPSQPIPAAALPSQLAKRN